MVRYWKNMEKSMGNPSENGGNNHMGPWDLAYFQTHPYQIHALKLALMGVMYLMCIYICIYIYIRIIVSFTSKDRVNKSLHWLLHHRQLNYLSNNQAGYEIVIHPQCLLLSPQFLLLNVKPGSIYHKGVILIRIDISNTETVNPGLTWVFHS